VGALYCDWISKSVSAKTQNNTENMKTGRIITRIVVGVALLLPLLSVPAMAAGDTPKTTTEQKATGGGGDVKGYAADSPVQIGTIVQLKTGTPPKVLSATNKDLNQMYGVAVDPHELSLTISNDSLANETYVATSGTYDVLVSTEGGPIKTGDFVTLSAINGVAMKSSPDQSIVFGRAVESFSGKAGLGNVTLKDTTGQVTQTVSLGIISVTINIQRNPDKKSTKVNVPRPLQRIGQAIAEKPVSPVRIYLSVAVTVLCIIIAITVLYSGIRNSIISIGRNPLSKKTIFRGLVEIILTSFLILIIGLFTVYLLLKL
jgi:hypothetical protein